MFVFILVCDAYCDFVSFPFCTFGHVWYLIVLIPNPLILNTVFERPFQSQHFVLS